MPYRFINTHESLSDFASGSVIRSVPGQTAFPVRLAREMFEQSLAYRAAEGLDGPCALYDPCCGSGYLLTTLGFIYNQKISHIVASDIDTNAVELALSNLALLTIEGLDARINDLAEKYATFGKESHHLAITSARSMRQKLVNSSIQLHTFQTDARSEVALQIGLRGLRPEIVISDLPYESTVHWHSLDGAIIDSLTATAQMLSALHSLLAPSAIVALATEKGQKVAHANYERLRQMTIGKRRITWLKPS